MAWPNGQMESFWARVQVELLNRKRGNLDHHLLAKHHEVRAVHFMSGHGSKAFWPWASPTRAF
jgi:hypothetical protein